MRFEFYESVIWRINLKNQKECDSRRLLERIIDRWSKLRFISIALFIFTRDIKMLNIYSKRLRSYKTRPRERWKYEKISYVWIEMWKKLFHCWSRIKKNEKMSRDNDNEGFINSIFFRSLRTRLIQITLNKVIIMVFFLRY